MHVSVVNSVLAVVHGENYYVFTAEQTVRPKLDLSNIYLQSLFTSHSYLILGILTFIIMFVACIIGIFYRMPNYEENEISQMSLFVKILLSLFGGIMSLLYLINKDGGISIETVFLVGLCSYITPPTFHLIHAACVKAVEILLGVLIKRFVFLITGEMIDKANKNDETDNMGDRSNDS